MKRFCLLVTLLGLFSFLAESQTISFEYDKCGNRKGRVIVLQKSMEQNAIDSIEVKEDKTFSGLIVKIYPNPTDGILQVEILSNREYSEDDPVLQLFLYNMTGIAVEHQVASYGISTFDLSKQPTGVYILVFSYNNNLSRWKIIKR